MSVYACMTCHQAVTRHSHVCGQCNAPLVTALRIDDARAYNLWLRERWRLRINKAHAEYHGDPIAIDAATEALDDHEDAFSGLGGVVCNVSREAER